MKVLLIDDEVNLLTVTEDHLRSEDYEVVTAADGHTGLQLVDETHPDVVVTDLRMDGMDGIEVVTRLKRSHASLPVLVLTAYGEIDSAVKAMKAGALDYLTKPIDPVALSSALRRAVSESRRELERVYLREELSDRLGF